MLTLQCQRRDNVHVLSCVTNTLFAFETLCLVFFSLLLGFGRAIASAGLFPTTDMSIAYHVKPCSVQIFLFNTVIHLTWCIT